MNNSKVETKRKLKITRLFSIIFSIMLVVSLFASISVLANENDLKLDEATITEKSDTVSGEITSVSNDKIKDDVTFHRVNDDITYKLVVKNNLSEEINILSITDDNKNNYIDYEYDQHKNEKLGAGDSFDFYVTTRYNSSVTDMSKRDQKTTTNFIIKYSKKDSKKSNSIVVNPGTGDNIGWSFVMLIISSAGLITCIVLDKKNSNKKFSKTTMTAITGLLLTPLIVKAATYTYDISLVSNYGLYDKQVVTYTVNGEEKTMITEYGETVTGLETPIEDGYIFDKWVYEDGTDFDPTKELTSDIKIIAKMNKITYSISYDLNGGTVSSTNPTEYTVTDNITLVEPTKEHYTFTGWTGTDLTTPTKNVVIKNKTGNRSYSANYEPTNYTVTYKGLTAAEKSALNNPTSYNIESNEVTLNNPQNRKDADGDVTEIFAGWKDGTTTSTTITLPNLNSMGNKTYEAVWTEASTTTYTITYNLNGGTTATANPVEFTKNTDTFTLVNPTKVGYEFKGWSGTDLTGDENKEVKVTKGTKKNLSFEAHYNPINYQIKYEKNADNVTGTMSNQTLTYDTESNLTEVAYAKTGYTFKGWNTKADGSGTHYADKAAVNNLTTTKNDVISLYAEWKANSYKIEFNNNGGTGTMSDLDMTYDEAKNLTKSTFTKEGYSFDGWNTESDGNGTHYADEASVKNLATSGTATLYAEWKANSYKIAFNNNGGTGTMSDLDMTYDQAKNLTKSTFTKEGYSFDGWNTESDGSGTHYTDEAEVKNLATSGTATLYAEWKANSYKVEFEANAPEESTATGEMEDVSMVYDTPKNLPENEYSVPGYTFDGWNTKTDGTGTHYADKAEVNNLATSGTATLYAEWKANSYKIEFNNNGGTGTMSDLDMTYDQSKKLTKSTFTKDGYSFGGWNTKADKTGTHYDDEASVKNLATSGKVTLYAEWTVGAYKIAFNNNGGSGTMSDLDMTYDEAKNLTKNTFTKTGYSFDGWNTKADGSGAHYADEAEVNNLATSGTVTLYAEWKANSYTINLMANTPEGSTATGEMEDVSMVYDTPKNLPENEFDVVGYTFDGWNTKADGSGTHYADKAEVNNLAESGTVKLYAEWKENTDTEYTVIHKKMNLDGTTYAEADRETLTGTTNAEVTPDVKVYTGFTSPSTKTVTIKADGSTVVEYLYSRNKYTLTINDAEYVETDKSGEHFYGEEVELTAKDREDYKFTGWSNGDSEKTITLVISGSITIRPTYEYNVYMITLNPNGGGVSPSEIKVTKGEAVGTLPTPVKQFNDFAGWYTSLEFTTEVTAETIPEGDVTYYAKWDPFETPGLVCRKATSLHTTECTATSCQNAGYKTNGSKGTNIVTFGSIAHVNLVGGNAYDCDVNGDGVYDEDTERFYYLTTKGENAVLISHTNYEGEDGQATANNFTYPIALTKLPTKTTDQWKNVRVTFTNPVDSSDENIYAARFATYDELKAATGKTDLTAVGSLDDYPYLMENTTFVGTGRTGIWLESFPSEGQYYRIQSGATNRQVTTNNTTSNVARPVIEVPLEFMDITSEDTTTYTITYESNGGTSVEPLEVEENTPIGELPEVTRGDYEFDGWYYEPEFTTLVKETDLVTKDITIYAKWTIDAVAVINDSAYTSLTNAINAVPTNKEETVVKLLKDTSDALSIANTKNIVLDLQNHTLTNSSGACVIENKGYLVVKNGTMTSNSTANGTINNLSGATIKIIDASIGATGSKQALYNNGGTAEISGDSHMTNTASDRATLHNLNNGVMSIVGGEIVSTKYHAVYNEAGTLTIGESDGVIDTTKPVLQGGNVGLSLKDSQKFNFYDGIIKGKQNAIDKPANLDGKEENSEILNDTEEIDGATYKTAIMHMEASKYRVTFNADGGTVSPAYKIINIGDPVGELPTPSKGVYTFDGWFSAKTGGEEIDSSYIPSENITIYARYHYTASDEIVDFDMTSDAMKTYYSNLNTWLSDTSTFQTNMDANFNNYNCSECTGPSYQACPTPAANKTLCEQSKGYMVGVDSLKVYESNASKEKGSLVTYTTVKDESIYNMIPGQIYYWESADDSNVHGYVKANGKRRTIASNVRNVRDLGGLEVDTDNDGTVDGTIKYGKIFRGAKLSSSASDVTELEKLGITEEVDLRGSSGDAKFTNYKGRAITNYLIYPDTYASNYTVFRKALVDTMQDVINGENIYFHCAIGTDRTGTMAYFLEGLLGVSEEDRLQDYENSYFTGLLNRNRFHDHLDGSSINPRFTTMHNTYPTNQSIYEYFMSSSTDTTSDAQLIQNFRTAMIDYN